MAEPMKLDDFLTSQTTTGFTATLEPIPDRPKDVKVTPFRDGHGCGCASSFELAKDKITSVTPTGQFHFCCGQRLEIAVVEFAENASIPVTDLIKQRERASEHSHLSPGFHPGGSPMPTGGSSSSPRFRGGASPWGRGVVGRWPLPDGCDWVCIEVCTEFCSDTGWNCCKWETRCGKSCGNLMMF